MLRESSDSGGRLGHKAGSGPRVPRLGRVTPTPPTWPSRNPPPLTATVSLVAVEAIVMILLAVLELADATPGRLGLGLSTAGFFAAYGGVLLLAAWGLWTRRPWARGPVLITQLILIGLAWSLREHWPVALALVVVACVALAGVLHPDSLAALDGDADDAQPSDSSD